MDSFGYTLLQKPLMALNICYPNVENTDNYENLIGKEGLKNFMNFKNKPTGDEVSTCNGYLLEELKTLPSNALVVSLGSIAHKAVLKALNLKQSDFPFGHGSIHKLSVDLIMIDSYHCSRYNTQTRRLTAHMFSAIFLKARELLKKNDRSA